MSIVLSFRAVLKVSLQMLAKVKNTLLTVKTQFMNMREFLALDLFGQGLCHAKLVPRKSGLIVCP